MPWKAAPQLAQEVKGCHVDCGQTFTVLGNSTLSSSARPTRPRGQPRARVSSLPSLGQSLPAGRVMREHGGTVQAFMGALAGVAVVGGGVVALGVRWRCCRRHWRDSAPCWLRIRLWQPFRGWCGGWRGGLRCLKQGRLRSGAARRAGVPPAADRRAQRAEIEKPQIQEGRV